MKKTLVFLMCIVVINSLRTPTFAFSVVPVNVGEYPIFTSSLSAQDIIKLSANEFGKLAGKK